MAVTGGYGKGRSLPATVHQALTARHARLPSGAMLDQSFDAETFRARRERVFEAIDSSVMVLPGASVRYASRDTEYRFRPDSELYYVTGVLEPDAVAVLRGHAEEQRFVLFVRERAADAELWSGPRVGPGDAVVRYDADAAYSTAELTERLPSLLAGARAVHYRLGRGTETDVLVQKALRQARARGARKGTGPRSVIDPGVVLDEMRLRKDAGEVQRIRRATSITVDAFRLAGAGIRPGRGEWELEAMVDGAFRSAGADGPGYQTIVASGESACVLHYVDNARVVRSGNLVLLDAGAAVSLYHADLTRTFPASGSFTESQRSVYEIVERARDAAVKAVRPGALVADVHETALREIVGGLIALDVLEGPVEDRIGDEGYKPFFPHQTSHWLGLDVHDVGDYARNGVSRRLEPGMVLTVEPGLYLRPGFDDVPDRLRGIGVRVEDDVLVTEDGHEVLSAELPTAASEVEALMARNVEGM